MKGARWFDTPGLIRIMRALFGVGSSAGRAADF